MGVINYTTICIYYFVILYLKFNYKFKTNVNCFFKELTWWGCIITFSLTTIFLLKIISLVIPIIINFFVITRFIKTISLIILIILTIISFFIKDFFVIIGFIIIIIVLAFISFFINIISLIILIIIFIRSARQRPFIRNSLKQEKLVKTFKFPTLLPKLIYILFVKFIVTLVCLLTLLTTDKTRLYTLMPSTFNKKLVFI